MKTLKIQNLILIEKAEIALGPGLNIFTGETGSGKSAVLSAIRLLAGGRADGSCIRQGAEFALVEAHLEGDIFVRREIHRSGKNRCFIDDSQVSLAALKEAIQIEMIDQSSACTVLQNQAEMLDTFGGFREEVKEFERKGREERELEASLLELSQTPKERELEWARKDLEIIEEAGWREGEEAQLNEEHHFLTHASTLSSSIGEVAFTLTEGGEIASLKRSLGQAEQCLRLDPRLQESVQAMRSALLELEEVGRSVQSYANRLEADPRRLAEVEARLAVIESLKRKFGSNLEEQKKKLIGTIDRLENLDAKAEELKRELGELKRSNEERKLKIREQRKKAAVGFAEQVQAELQSLNIPYARFEIIVEEGVQFVFSANPGSPPVPLEQCASGGELSRLLLAIKTVLSDGNSTLVFDEIDSNVGGQTATILGQKIKRLAQTRQVICVTHFVQVAKCATNHFLVSKTADSTRSYTSVTKLREKERENEYYRMLGAS